MVSENYLMWKAIIDLRTCRPCRVLHGKVYPRGQPVNPDPPLHPRCRCAIRALQALFAGTATKRGMDGADWWLKYRGKLPEYYINKQDAKDRGWKPREGNLANVAPGMMIGMDSYDNRNGHLPFALGREWLEADINYISGRRGLERIVYSNDG